MRELSSLRLAVTWSVPWTSLMIMILTEGGSNWYKRSRIVVEGRGLDLGQDRAPGLEDLAPRAGDHVRRVVQDPKGKTQNPRAGQGPAQ